MPYIYGGRIYRSYMAAVQYVMRFLGVSQPTAQRIVGGWEEAGPESAPAQTQPAAPVAPAQPAPDNSSNRSKKLQWQITGRGYGGAAGKGR